MVDLPVGRLESHGELTLRLHVFRGLRPGPRLFVTAGIHGDELNGVEVARRLLELGYRGLCGDLIVVPIANLPSFMLRSRYLPDHRDLNRLFPGNADGSFGSRIARSLVDEVVQQCTHGIDLHTASPGRINLPQIRYSGAQDGSGDMAEAFGAPVVLKSVEREGTLRATCGKLGVPYVIYEAGEAMRLDMPAVSFGFRGVQRVMKSLGMLRSRGNELKTMGVYCHSSGWVRAGTGGLFRALVPLGRAVEIGQVIGMVGDPFADGNGPGECEIVSDREGIVIGRTTASLVDEGDALFHVGESTAVLGRAEEEIIKTAELVIPRGIRPPYRDHHADH